MSVLLLTMGPQLGITADLPVVAVGGAGVIRFRAIGAAGLVKWTLVDSTLPAEWDSALNPDGNAVTLTTADAETPGTFSVTVRAVDNARIPVVRSFDVRVMALPLTISGAFPEWEVGEPVTGALTINGGVPPYSGLSIISGSLPSGVSLSIVGNQIVPSGEPTVAGPWSATVQVSDSLSTYATNVASGDVIDLTDPYWEHVVALLHFDGADGSTTFIDVAGVSWTANGGAQIDTADSKFGASSLLLSSEDDGIYSSDISAFGFGTGDFTLELWIKTAASGIETTLFDLREGSGNITGSFFISSARRLAFWDGALTGGIGSAVPNNAWTHIAFARAGGTLRAFIGGVLQWAASNSSNFTTSRPCRIGDSGFGAVDKVNGWIDEVRITKGVARYTADFTPPDIAFPNK